MLAIPVEDWWKIFFMWRDNNKTVAEINEQAGFCDATIVQWINRYQATGTVDRKYSTGAKRVTTVEEDINFVAASHHDPFKSAVRIWQESGVNCH